MVATTHLRRAIRMRTGVYTRWAAAANGEFVHWFTKDHDTVLYVYPICTDKVMGVALVRADGSIVAARMTLRYAPALGLFFPAECDDDEMYRAVYDTED